MLNKPSTTRTTIDEGFSVANFFNKECFYA